MGTSIRSVYLEVKQTCPTPDIILPPGRYLATLTQEVVIQPSGSAEWQDVHYCIALNQPRLRQIGGEHWQDRNSIELDVTDCVSAGLIEVDGAPSRRADKTIVPHREDDATDGIH
ncbi:hypothetical protein ACLBXM_11045 [Xanthobacteraceae bacterium A53D]